MDNPHPPFPSSLSRRTFLAAAAAATALPAAGLPGAARADALPTVKVGTLPFGTVQWEVNTIKTHGFDKAAGVAIENVPLASNEAGRIAFLSGSVDTVVNDLLFAARLKAEGRDIRFLPFSTEEGGVMVPAASKIKTIADLKGRSIGVAGGPLDKSWLILRAAAKKAGLDLAEQAKPVFGAPPLLAAKVESGELDCGLLYWSYCARLSAKGFRQMVTVEQLASDLGARGKIAFVGFLFRGTVPEATLSGFAKAVRQAEALLGSDPQAWHGLRPVMGAKDEPTFTALKSDFIEGIPHKGRAEEIKDAQAFYATLAKLGGSALVGTATSLPEDLYVAPAVYG